MKCKCTCDTEPDLLTRQIIAAAICAAFAPTEYLIFRKAEWIEDCGFLISEQDVELPRRFDGKNAKIHCYTECLHLLNDGWDNKIAERSREMMEKYLSGDS